MKTTWKCSGISLLATMLILFLAGCQTQEPETTIVAAPVIVAVSILPQATFVEAVCGEKAQVVVMVPPGSSPTNYEPSPKELENFSRAKVYFALGVPTEAANILPKAVETDGMSIVHLEEIVAAVYPERELAPGMRDPHIWLSPRRAQVMVQAIADNMAQLDPVNAGYYQANAANYNQQLAELDTQLQAALAGAKNKKFIVYHPAFGYLAEDYGLQMFALEEEGKEATPKRLAEMIDLAQREKIKAIFYQEEISSAQAQAFAEEIDGQTIQLAPLSPDYLGNLQRMAAVLAEVVR